MVFTTWRETSGNGAATGIALITTKPWPIKATRRTIHKGRIRRLTQQNPTRRSACIAAARSSATINTVHAILLAHEAKARSAPAQITLVFDVDDRQRISRNNAGKIRFMSKGSA